MTANAPPAMDGTNKAQHARDAWLRTAKPVPNHPLSVSNAKEDWSQWEVHASVLRAAVLKLEGAVNHVLLQTV